MTKRLRKIASLVAGLVTAGCVFAGSASAGLILYYPFNGNANDAAGSDNGVVHGATLTTDRFGNPNSAYSFNGSSSYISADASALPTGARTVDLWFDATTVSTEPVFLGYGGGACGTSFFVGLNASHASDYYVSSHCGVNTLIDTYLTAPTGQWHNFAVTTDSSGTDLYVDGVLVASNANFISNTTVAGTQLEIGVDVSPAGTGPYTDSNVGFFQGSLDEIRIYNTALSAHDICVLAGGCTSVPEPASWELLVAGLAGFGALRRRRKTA